MAQLRFPGALLSTPTSSLGSFFGALTAFALGLGCDPGSVAPESAIGGGGALAGGASSMAGTSGAGGATAGGSDGVSGSGEAASFKLLFRDDFEQLDTSRWQLMTHSWAENLALFGETSVAVADGELRLSLLPAPSGTVDSEGKAKAFHGAEVRSLATLTYGKVRGRIRFAAGSAVISSLVTIYTPWPADDWNELDVEALGKAPSRVQFNTMVYTGAPPTPPVEKSVMPTQEPHLPTLGFDPSADFHVYTIEWTPERAVFSVDDKPTYTWTKHIGRMKLPQNVLLTIWASSAAGWAGAVDEGTGMAQARYDWVELYQYEP